MKPNNETKDMVRIVARVPEEMAVKLKLKAVRERTSMQELIRQAVEDLLKKGGKP
jgi:Ribbon-helix-helix protein, copG family